MASPQAANLNDAEEVADLLRRAAGAMRESPLRSGCAVRLPRGRLLVTGDLHDNQEHLRTIIALAKLDASPDHHVVLHELIHGDRLINGMDFSYRMLARVAELALRYPQQVHPILANHEMSQLTGAGVSKGAGNSVELFDDALEYVFGEQGALVGDAVREFIRAMPLALLSGQHEASHHQSAGVLCAHSLPDAIAMRWFDTAILDRELADDDYRGPTGSAYSMVWGRRFSEEQIETLGEKWNVKLFCLGHQHVEDGIETRGDRVVVLNSDHDQAKVLPLDLAALPIDTQAAVSGAISLAAVV